MVEDRQLVLFFNNSYDINLIADILVRKFSFLNEVLVIPPTEENAPNIVFQKGEVKLTIFRKYLNLNYLINFDFDLIIEIIETLENEGFVFNRMGYISIYFHKIDEKIKFIENSFKKEEKRNQEFQLYRYSSDLIDSVKVNVVEIEKTNPEKDLPMITIFDINTPVDEIYNITSSFLGDFIKECDKYAKNVVRKNFE